MEIISSALEDIIASLSEDGLYTRKQGTKEQEEYKNTVSENNLIWLDNLMDNFEAETETNKDKDDKEKTEQRIEALVLSNNNNNNNTIHNNYSSDSSSFNSNSSDKINSLLPDKGLSTFSSI